MKQTLLALALLGMAVGQTKPTTVAISHAIHAVNDLDTTLKYYQDVFQITAPAQDFPNAAVPLLTNAPGVTLRLAMIRLPGSPHGFELTHFKGLERKPAQAKFTDPGAGHLMLLVRDLNKVADAAKAAKAPIVTTGGAPVEIDLGGGRKARAIAMRDPDGFFNIAIEMPAAPGAPEGNVHMAAVAYTMESLEATQKFYNGIMGFQLTPTEFKKDPAFMKLIGAPESTEIRRFQGTFPGSIAPVDFMEFRGVPRTKFHLRVRDPGAPAMAIQVSNLDGMLAEMKAAGINFISANGEVVQFSPTVRNIFVEDPNGVNIELFERLPGAAKGPAKGKGK